MFRSPPRGIREGYRESVEDHSSGIPGHRSDFLLKPLREQIARIFRER